MSTAKRLKWLEAENKILRTALEMILRNNEGGFYASSKTFDGEIAKTALQTTAMEGSCLSEY